MSSQLWEIDQQELIDTGGNKSTYRIYVITLKNLPAGPVIEFEVMEFNSGISLVTWCAYESYDMNEHTAFQEVTDILQLEGPIRVSMYRLLERLILYIRTSAKERGKQIPPVLVIGLKGMLQY